MSAVPKYDNTMDELSIGLTRYLALQQPIQVEVQKSDTVQKDERKQNNIKIKSNDDLLISLIARVEKLEANYVVTPNDKVLSSNEMSSIIRAKHAVQASKCYSAIWKWVPSNYYSLSLQERAKILGTQDKMQLCKALLFENRSIDKSSNFDRNNSQFYLVIVQYGAEINTKKLELEIRSLLPLQERLEPSKYNFRLASEEDNDRLTGYVHNSVTPFGMLAQNKIPIIVASSIVRDLRFMFMGGGHVDLKLGCSVTEFCSITAALVLDISDTR